MGNYASVVLADKPIRYYRLSETSGTTALDQSSNLANGTLNGGVTLNQAGLLTADPDPCMLFNGTSGYISLPTSGLPTGASAWSMECWVYFSSLPAGGTFGGAISFGTKNTNQMAEIYYSGSSQIFKVADVSADIVTGPSYAANTAYHLVATYDGTTLKFYQNNVLVGSASTSLNITTGFAHIGYDNGNAGFFAGRIDEAAYYNTALSAAQISNHYLAGSGALNFPVVPLTAATRDGHMTTTTRDGLSLTTKTRG